MLTIRIEDHKKVYGFSFFLMLQKGPCCQFKRNCIKYFMFYNIHITKLSSDK